PPPYRDAIISPSEVSTAEDRLNQINQQRAAEGKTPLHVEVTRQTRPDEHDPVMIWERATARISGASEEELQDIDLTNVAAEPEKKARTEAVLAATMAITRIDSAGEYVSRNEGGGDSTPARAIQYVNDAPGGELRTRYAPTSKDFQKARNVRAWARTVQPTNDYMQAMRSFVGAEQLGPRGIGTAASAVAAYNSSVSTSQGRGSGLGAAKGSRWLNTPGDKIMVTGRVEQVTPVFHEKRWDPRHLYIIRTPEGDAVKWLPSDFRGFRMGEEVTLRGVVKQHLTFRGERQTEMYYCTPQIHNA